jgi:hypothetical protein
MPVGLKRRRERRRWIAFARARKWIMDSLIVDVGPWAEQQFGSCVLGDQRRTKRLVKLATQIAAKPDASTPGQTQHWADCKAAYRLMDCDDVTFSSIIAPHCQLTRARTAGRWLLIDDTTEISIPIWRDIPGLGPVGNGGGQGFLLHTAMMVSAGTEELVGIAGQELFLRKPRKNKNESSAQRKLRPRESQVWSRVIDDVGAAPADAEFIHVCDRGADNIEVFAHALARGHGWVIRASHLPRSIRTVNERSPDDPTAGQRKPLAQLLAMLPVCGEYDLDVRANKDQPARTARLELRFGPLWMPQPQHVSPWTREHAPQFIRMNVVEVIERHPPKGIKPLRWVLYTSLPVASFDDAWQVVGYYEKRPLVEEYHKSLKTGCSVEKRQYFTGERLRRIIAVLSITAVRLVQLKTIARVEPDRPAVEVVPQDWVDTLVKHRQSQGREIGQPSVKGAKHAKGPKKVQHVKGLGLTVREFFRQLAMLGGFLGRKGDGEPGWITIWRGLTDLLRLVQGYRLAEKKCG